MRNEKTSAAAIKAVQNNIGCQTALIDQVEELIGSFVAPPEGTVSITENGTHDVSGAATAQVDVQQKHVSGIVYGDGTTSLQLPAKVLGRYKVLVYAPIGIGDADNAVILIWIAGFKSSDSRVCYTDSDGIHWSRDALTISGSGLITVNDECGVFTEEFPYEIYAFDY